MATVTENDGAPRVVVESCVLYTCNSGVMERRLCFHTSVPEVLLLFCCGHCCLSTIALFLSSSPVLVVLSAGSCVCGLPLPTSKRPRGGPLPPAGWRSSCHVTGHPASSSFLHSLSPLSRCSQTLLLPFTTRGIKAHSCVLSSPYLLSCVYSLPSVHKVPR